MCNSAQTIYETVAMSQGTEQVELIPVSEKIVLLRSKELPDVAFVMWISEYTSTAARMVFFVPAGTERHNHTVVCACCEHGEDFRDALYAVCREKDITFLIMRNAKPSDGRFSGVFITHPNADQKYWAMKTGERYPEPFVRRPDPGSVGLLDSEDHREVLCKLYPIALITRAHVFIDAENSYALGLNRFEKRIF